MHGERERNKGRKTRQAERLTAFQWDGWRGEKAVLSLGADTDTYETKLTIVEKSSTGTGRICGRHTFPGVRNLQKTWLHNPITLKHLGDRMHVHVHVCLRT
jgi:hypothetical protein